MGICYHEVWIRIEGDKIAYKMLNFDREKALYKDDVLIPKLYNLVSSPAQGLLPLNG